MTNESIWDKVDLIEKRFKNRLDLLNPKFNTLNPVWDNEKGDALNVFEMIDELNRLNLDCSNLIDDNTEYVAEINQMHKENEQLKSDLKDCKKLKNKRLNKIRNHRAVIEDLGGSIRAYKGKLGQANEKIEKIKEAMEDTGALTKRQLEEILND